MKKVVLDTNVIVSAFLSPTGKPAALLLSVLLQELEIQYNTEIMIEYEQVLGRTKFSEKIKHTDVQAFLERLRDFGANIINSRSTVAIPDESDRKFYDVAKTANAILITGNKKHYPNEPFIQDPAEFFSNWKEEVYRLRAALDIAEASGVSGD